MKILNLYAGLGGNRKLWGPEHEVTAVEFDPTIAKFYQDHFAGDKVVIADAHDYLLNHYSEFDFIWSSITCPSHSRARYWSSRPNDKVKPIFPDFKLYEEIVFLKHYFDGEFVVENVVPYYQFLIEPSVVIGRHAFWSNFNILQFESNDADIKNGNVEEWQELHGFNISGYSFDQRRDKVLRNCVQPKLGKHILDCAIDYEVVRKSQNVEQMSLL